MERTDTENDEYMVEIFCSYINNTMYEFWNLLKLITNDESTKFKYIVEKLQDKLSIKLDTSINVNDNIPYANNLVTIERIKMYEKDNSFFINIFTIDDDRYIHKDFIAEYCNRDLFLKDLNKLLKKK